MVWFRLVLIWSSVFGGIVQTGPHLVLCWWYGSDWSSSGPLFVGGIVQTGPHLVLCLLVVWFRLVLIWSSVCWWYGSDWSSSGPLLVVWFRLVLIWSSLLVQSVVWVMSSASVRTCPTCKASIQKSGGCNKMSCYKCGAMFCWICGVCILG